MTDLTLESAVSLPGGRRIPLLGLGVFKAGAHGGTRQAVAWALEAGYRHIDTAKVYRNEREVGEALRTSEVPRSDVFLTTKLWRDDYDDPRAALDASLAALGVDHVDLYLLHWPRPDRRVAAWRALSTLVEEGRCRAIGVSNFTEAQIDELVDATGVVPAVNQFELHAFRQQPALVAHCRQRGIVVEAWGTLTKGQRLDDARLIALAAEVGRTPAQVLLRWSLQRGFVTIPKSSRKERIEENARLYDSHLDAGQMAAIAGWDEAYRTAPGWDPTSAT